MSTAIGYGGSGGVGRPFTIQDLFAAVQPATPVGNGIITIPVNETVEGTEAVVGATTVTYSLYTSSQRGYNAGTYLRGIWTS